MEEIKKIEKGNLVGKIYQDDDPGESPRTWDNMGKIVAFHKRYDLGDKTELKFDQFDGWDALQKHLIDNEKAAFCLPLYLYDHSGLHLKIGSFAGLLPQGHAEFDSGQVGFVYVTKETIRKEFGTAGPANMERAKGCLKSEIANYNQYLEGDVYRYAIERKCATCGHDSEMVDSMGGIFGLDQATEDLNDAMDAELKAGAGTEAILNG